MKKQNLMVDKMNQHECKHARLNNNPHYQDIKYGMRERVDTIPNKPAPT